MIARGKPQEGFINIYTARAMLMEKYHQPYSEIRKMPNSDVVFLCHLTEARMEYEKQEQKKYEAKMRAMRKR